MLLSSINTTFIRRNRRIHILYSTMGNTLVSFCMLLILKTKRRIQGDFGHLKFVKKLANWQNINTISNAESITMRPSCHLPSLHGIRVNKRTSFARWLFWFRVFDENEADPTTMTGNFWKTLKNYYLFPLYLNSVKNT